MAKGIITRQSPLVYPAGAEPGIDRSHPAANGLVMSAVPVPGANFINLTSGKLFTSNTSLGVSPLPTYGIKSPYGPFVNVTSVTGPFPQTPGSNTVQSTVLLGAIFTSSSPQTFCATITTSGGGSISMYVLNQSGVITLDLWCNSANHDSGLVLAVNTPYFAAISASSTAVYFIAKNLITGQVRTASFGSGVALGANDVNIYLAEDAFNSSLAGDLAAAMYSANVPQLGLAQLRAWADDPWSFWYPNKAIEVSAPDTPVVSTTGGARVPQRFNQSKLAYPAGAEPGYDPSHPAAGGAGPRDGLSVVSTGKNFVDLITARVGVNADPAISSSIKSLIGPGTVFPVAASSIDFVGNKTTGPPLGRTYGAIVQFDSVSSGNFQTIVITGGVVLTLFGLSQTAQLLLYQGGISTESGIFPAVNTPYFLAASSDGTVRNYLMLNLRSGVTTSATVGAAAALDVPNGTYEVGANGPTSPHPAYANIATAMYAPTFLTPIQLSQWAKDPWAFWYPNKTIEMFAQAATPVVSTTQYAAFYTPQHDGVVYTQMTGY